jgi:hypothetical protein
MNANETKIRLCRHRCPASTAVRLRRILRR